MRSGCRITKKNNTHLGFEAGVLQACLFSFRSRRGYGKELAHEFLLATKDA